MAFNGVARASASAQKRKASRHAYLTGLELGGILMIPTIIKVFRLRVCALRCSCPVLVPKFGDPSTSHSFSILLSCLPSPSPYHGAQDRPGPV